MKWYNYKDQWINIDNTIAIEICHDTLIRFHFSGDDVLQGLYNSKEERDAEFEKIKALMGIGAKDDWTPGRCC